MSRTLFFILAIVALLVSVSAQSSSSSSSYKPVSSSSSYVVPSSSTGGSKPTTVSSFVTSSQYPVGTYSVQFYVQLLVVVNASNVNQIAENIKLDIVFNLARLEGLSNTTVASSVQVTSVNGTGVTSSNRRLLDNTQNSAVTWLLLPNSAFTSGDAVNKFAVAAKNGSLSAPNSGSYASYPAIQPSVVNVGPQSSSSSTGNGAVPSTSAASAGLLFAAVASLAALLL